MAFNAVNQSYFMGSFFFLSGAMSSTALNRKGRRAFLRSKWLKLGVPVVVYALVVPPLLSSTLKVTRGEPLNVRDWVTHWKGLRGVRGPVWYTALLLVFDTAYSFLPRSSLQPLAGTSCLPLLVLDIGANFLVRLWYPVGKIFVPLNLQPAYLPQYIACYLLGGAQGKSSPPVLTRSEKSILLFSSAVSGASLIALLYANPLKYTISSGSGGPNILALSYAVWNETTGYLLGTSILSLFRSSKRLSESWGGLGMYSYAAFLVHPVVCVGLQACADGWNVNGVLKTVVVGTASVIGSWGIGWALLKFPGVKKILA
jgi:glucans biosynthesis protein C